MPTAYSYERVSSVLQAEKGGGLERQATAAEQWCAARGLELNETLRLSDAGRSAYKGDHLNGALGRFLELAQNDQLGNEPILLVEAIDRLSRLEAVDGLQDVLLALVRSGVSIVTLEDGAEYSRATLREDGSKLIILAVKAQAAWEYSRRLSNRVTASWRQAEADLEKGLLRRAGIFCPPWARLEGDQIVLIPEKVEVVRTVFSYAMHDGEKTVTDRLNAEGVPTLNGKPKWARTGVRRLLRDTRVYGAIRLGKQEDYSVEDREKLQAAGVEERVYEDLLPLVMPKDEWELLQARRASRAHPGSSTGRRGKCWNIASARTRCSCGAAASMVMTNSGNRRRLRYLRCSAKCGAQSYRLDQVNGHILVRLATGQLQQLLSGGDTQRGHQIRTEEQAINRLQARLDQAEQQQANAETALKDAVKAGAGLSDLLAEAVNEARNDAKAARAELNEAQQRLAGLRHEVDTEEFDAAVAELFDAFADGSDTPTQREQINRLIQAAGLQVTLDKEQRRIGMAIGDGPVDWQLFDPQAIQQALVARITSAQFKNLAFTEESVEALSALDPGMAEWFRSMVGVKQTAVASVSSKDLEAIQRFARDIQKNSPELAEALRKMNQDS